MLTWAKQLTILAIQTYLATALKIRRLTAIVPAVPLVKFKS